MDPESELDQYEQHLEELTRQIRKKGRLRDETSYKGPVWNRIQSEIDALTEEMLDYEASIPELRKQERKADWSVRKIGIVALLGALLIGGACFLGWISWWWVLLAVVLAFVGLVGAFGPS